MSLYQISYDLRKQRNYDALYERIKAYGNWCHALESSWVISTPQSAVQVRDNLRQVLDSDDGLLVPPLRPGCLVWPQRDHKHVAQDAARKRCGVIDRCQGWRLRQQKGASGCASLYAMSPTSVSATALERRSKTTPLAMSVCCRSAISEMPRPSIRRR